MPTSINISFRKVDLTHQTSVLTLLFLAGMILLKVVLKWTVRLYYALFNGRTISQSGKNTGSPRKVVKYKGFLG